MCGPGQHGPHQIEPMLGSEFGLSIKTRKFASARHRGLDVFEVMDLRTAPPPPGCLRAVSDGGREYSSVSQLTPRGRATTGPDEYDRMGSNTEVAHAASCCTHCIGYGLDAGEPLIAIRLSPRRPSPSWNLRIRPRRPRARHRLSAKMVAASWSMVEPQRVEAGRCRLWLCLLCSNREC